MNETKLDRVFIVCSTFHGKGLLYKSFTFDSIQYLNTCSGKIYGQKLKECQMIMNGSFNAPFDSMIGDWWC